MVETWGSGKVAAEVDLSAVAQDILPADDDTYNIGSASKRWASIYAMLAVLTSLLIGGVLLSVSPAGILVVNDSMQINGSLNVTENITAGYFFGDGSQLTGVVGGIWTNVSGVATYLDDVNISGNLDVNNISADWLKANYLELSGNITTVDVIKFEQDTTNHLIYDNSTCMILEGDTASVIIC